MSGKTYRSGRTERDQNSVKTKTERPHTFWLIMSSLDVGLEDGDDMVKAFGKQTQTTFVHDRPSACSGTSHLQASPLLLTRSKPSVLAQLLVTLSFAASSGFPIHISLWFAQVPNSKTRVLTNANGEITPKAARAEVRSLMADAPTVTIPPRVGRIFSSSQNIWRCFKLICRAATSLR